MTPSSFVRANANSFRQLLFAPTKYEMELVWKAEWVPYEAGAGAGLSVSSAVGVGDSLYLAGMEADGIATIHRVHVAEDHGQLLGKWQFRAPQPESAARMQHITGLQVNDADSVLAVVCDDGWLYVERTHGGSSRRLRAHRPGDRLRAVALEPGYDSAILRAGSRLVVGGERGELALYGESWLGLSQIAILFRGREPITAITWHAEYIAWSSGNGTVRVYDSERNCGLCALRPPPASERRATAALSKKHSQQQSHEDARVIQTQLHWTNADHLCVSWWLSSASEASERSLVPLDEGICLAVQLVSIQSRRERQSSNVQVQTLWSYRGPALDGQYPWQWVVPCQWDDLYVVFIACGTVAVESPNGNADVAVGGCPTSPKEALSSAAPKMPLISVAIYAAQRVDSEHLPPQSTFGLKKKQRLSVESASFGLDDRVASWWQPSRAVWLMTSNTMLIVSTSACSSNVAEQKGVSAGFIRIRPCNIAEQIRWLSSQDNDGFHALRLAQQALKTDAQAIPSDILTTIADTYLEKQWKDSNVSSATRHQLDEMAARIPVALEGWQAPAWLWEKWIQRLLDVDRASILVSVIPTQQPVLRRELYDELFKQMLAKPAAEMLYAAQSWPLAIFSVNEQIEALEARLGDMRQQHNTNDNRDLLILTESLSALYTRSGCTEKTLFLMLEQDGKSVFAYIRKHRLFAAARYCLHALFALDAVEAAQTLAMADPGELDTETVLGILAAREPRQTMLYLEEVFRQAPENLRVPEDHERLLELLAREAPARVASFLQAEDCACRTNVAMRILTEQATSERSFSKERAILHFRDGAYIQAYELLLAEQSEEACIQLARKSTNRLEHWVFLAHRLSDPQKLLLIEECALPLSQILDIIHQRHLAGESIHLEAETVRAAFQRLEDQQHGARDATRQLRSRLHQLDQIYARLLLDDLLLPPSLLTQLERRAS
jgi:hypothetical protein